MAVKVLPKDEMVNAVGTKFEPSDWIEVTQDRINTFADCTEDHQFIHVDLEKAAQTPLWRHHCPRISNALAASKNDGR